MLIVALLIIGISAGVVLYVRRKEEARNNSQASDIETKLRQSSIKSASTESTKEYGVVTPTTSYKHVEPPALGEYFTNFLMKIQENMDKWKIKEGRNMDELHM